MLSEITPLILTFNEAPNIARTLARLTWAKRILVVDSFSTDGTLEILKQFPQVEVVPRRFDSFAGQCNFGLTHIRTPWVLSLDADYVLEEKLVTELAALNPAAAVAGYSVRFWTCVLGRALQAGLYPARTVLYRRDRAEYHDDGHAHRVQINGKVMALKARIYHDDRKSFSCWLASQDRYAVQEVKKLQGAAPGSLPLQDRLRKMIVPAPFVVFGYTLFFRRMIFEGWPGWYYVLQRTLAELILSLRLVEAKMQSKGGDDA